jgi:cobalt-zinc-cadmium efflux system protein
MVHAHTYSPPSRELRSGALTLALVANGALLVAEVAGGVAFGSLALLADAGHMLSDVVSLGISLLAQRLLLAPASARLTYGFQRAEVLGALANGIALVGISAWIVVEAVRRLDAPPEVAGAGLLAVASLGLVTNIGSAWLLARVRGRSLNITGAWLHMMADAAGSVGAMAAGVAVLVWGASWVDPVVSIAIAVLVVWSGWGLLRATVHVLLEGTPRGMDAGEVERAMAEDPEVETVHHLHLWNLASDVPALSAHVVLSGDVSLHDAQLRGDRLRAMLTERFGIEHATLELECHECDPQLEATGRRVARGAGSVRPQNRGSYSASSNP